MHINVDSNVSLSSYSHWCSWGGGEGRGSGRQGRAGQELVLEILMQVANGEDYVALCSSRGFHGSAPSQLMALSRLSDSLSRGFLLFVKSVTLWSQGDPVSYK